MKYLLIAALLIGCKKETKTPERITFEQKCDGVLLIHDGNLITDLQGSNLKITRGYKLGREYKGDGSHVAIYLDGQKEAEGDSVCQYK